MEKGGTGKSRVIQTITKLFEQKASSAILLESAYTGIAASLVDGKPLHTIGKILVDKSAERKAKGISDDTKRKLQEFWAPYKYLNIDECSVVSQAFLAELEKNISIGKQMGTSLGE